MRWLACLVLLAGCLRARATAVHPTEDARASNGTGSSTAIARAAPSAREVPQPSAEESTNLVSVELGALVPFTAAHDSTRIHVAPGVRVFGSQLSTVLFGVAVGADYVGSRGPGFALEGSVYVGNGGGDTAVIEQAIDLFAGVTVSGRARTSVAVGPSVGMLAMPGGHSVVMVGLGLRLSGRRE